MSHFPITHYRSLNDPFDRYFDDHLHLFDPWRDIERLPTGLSTRPSSFRWISQPSRPLSRPLSSFHTSLGNTLLPATNPTPSALSETFRVQLNVAGFNPESIKTRIEGRKVIVEAKQEDRQGEGDYSTREIRKTYELPDHAGKKKRISLDTAPRG